MNGIYVATEYTNSFDVSNVAKKKCKQFFWYSYGKEKKKYPHFDGEHCNFLVCFSVFRSEGTCLV